VPLKYVVGPGDEVIVPSFSFIATASPVIHVGATPVFVDVDKKTCTIDTTKIEHKVTKKTKAIIPVHLYGHPADMDPILEVANKNSIPVVEDACQAHGAQYKGKRVGGIGNSAFFSFYPSKNMTVYGDGGIITTRDDKLAQKLRMLRDHGRLEKYSHEIPGYNMRFNEIQAAIGIKQLEKLPQWNNLRHIVAEKYTASLNGVLDLPTEAEWARHVYHMYVVRTAKRDQLKSFLEKNGVSTGIHYPIPIHKQPAIVNTVGEITPLKNTDLAAETVLSLPMHPQLSSQEIEYVCDKVKAFFKA
jgi:dTDP-4-amino-4,6-dideoxygalactose transaminase